MSAAQGFSTLDRDRVFQELETRVFDLAIIGGGITAAGLAREAALRGLAVALLESADFASGTSSRSSKLIHGGLRYLAMGDVALVRETALERKVIFRMAPHLAERRWMVLPTRSYAGMIKFRAAVTAYEKLGAVEGDDLHQNWQKEDLAREEPLLNTERYPNAVAYREYLTDDARLVIANLRSAAAAGACLLNHAEVDGIRVEGGRASGIEATDRIGGQKIAVRARCVVNAAGPWVEAVRKLEEPDAPSVLHLSKGVHVSLPAQRLPLNHMLVLNQKDGRSIFAIRQGEVVFLGTTDTSYEHEPSLWPEIGIEDVEYLLRPLASYFSVDPPQPGDVTAAWAGLRPLVAQPGKKAKDMSRKDEIMVSRGGVVTVAGGKLTGYRRTVERILDSAGDVLGGKIADVEEGPLPGGDFDGDLERLSAGLAAEFGISELAAARMSRLYGCEAREVVGLGPEPIVDDVPILVGEVDWAVSIEGAAKVEDVVYRRTRAALYSPEASHRIVEPVARRMAELLGWNTQQVSEQVEQTRKQLAVDLSFSGGRS
ncbi:MAG: glycerol-3-phosphate dehydrogenase/oxidase [bacterium]|nr:glycerol-3-phosphate dehydrogenase/oxidase [bacterium]